MKEILLSVAIYLVLGIILVCAAMLPEYKDLVCPDGFYQEDTSLCGDGKGKWYVGSEVTGNEDMEASLEKIKKGANAITDHITWRFPFIISFFVVGSIYLVVLKRFPSGPEFAVAFMICFLYTFFAATFYDAHYYRFPRDNILDHVKRMEKNLAEKNLAEEKTKERINNEASGKLIETK